MQSYSQYAHVQGISQYGHVQPYSQYAHADIIGSDQISTFDNIIPCLLSILIINSCTLF
jgi:hypothetical protein